MAGPSADRITEWEGGSLSELVAALQSAAMPVRIEVIAPGATNSTAGEVHLLAGGLADAFAGSLRRDDAMAALQRLEGARFLVECRLPDPQSGSLSEAGPGAGSLKDRPVAALMRYCEEYVLTCRLEVSRGEERAVIGYRRGEIISTTVGGAEAASELLPEVLAWTEGSYEIILPEPVLPHVPGRTREASISRPSERRRHSTLPMTTAVDGKTAGATKTDEKGAATTAQAKPTPVWSPATAQAPTAPVPTAALPAEMTTRGTPPVPSVPLHSAPAPTRPAPQAKPPAPPRSTTTAGAAPSATPPKPVPTTTAASAKAAAATPASPPTTKHAPPLAAPSTILSGKSVPPLAPSSPVASAKPTAPAAQPTAAKAAPTAAAKPAQPVRPSQPAQAAATPASANAAASAPPQAAGRTKTAAAASSNDLLPASGTIEAKPKHATNLPPSTDPIQVVEQPGQVIVTSPAQPPAPVSASSRPSDQRRQRVASRTKGPQHTVRAYVFVGLAIGIGIVLAYWAYWYLPFGHH